MSEGSGESHATGDVETDLRLERRMLETVTYQEEIGRLQMIKCEGPRIVVSKGWPSWSHVCNL